MAYPNRISLAAFDHRQLFLTHHPRGGQPSLPKMLQLTQSEVGDMETGTRYRRDERMMAPTVDDYAEEIEDEEPGMRSGLETCDQQPAQVVQRPVSTTVPRKQQQRNDHAHLTTRRVIGSRGRARFPTFLHSARRRSVPHGSPRTSGYRSSRRSRAPAAQRARERRGQHDQDRQVDLGPQRR